MYLRTPEQRPRSSHPTLDPAPRRRPARFARRMAAALLGCTLAILPASRALAGDGRINNDNTIDLKVSVRFAPTALDLQLIRDHFTEASRILWDATDSQVRIGRVTIGGGTGSGVNEDAADVWIMGVEGRSFANLSGIGIGNTDGINGRKVTAFLPSLLNGSPTGMVMAHELGHYCFGLRDEYGEQVRFGTGCGIGQCMMPAMQDADGNGIDDRDLDGDGFDDLVLWPVQPVPVDLNGDGIDDLRGERIMNETHHCLMQSTQPGRSGVSNTEFCCALNHDTLRGDTVPNNQGTFFCPTLINNGADNDEDGQIDDSAAAGNVFALPENNTTNGLDDDGDGWPDDTAAFGTAELDPWNGIDDDGDGVIDDGHPFAMQELECNTDATSCQRYNTLTGRFEGTTQTQTVGSDCWTAVANLLNITPPAPNQAPNPVQNLAGFVNPEFDLLIEPTDTVVLTLDVSGSMNSATIGDGFEVCANGIDDNDDGQIDEAACSQSRLDFMKAAARAFVRISEGKGVNVAVVSFNDVPLVEKNFDEVVAANVADFDARINALTASGLTAIGDALTTSAAILHAEVSNNTKTILLVSDGKNTTGPEPKEVQAKLRDDDVRVFTVSTGEASDDATLREISSYTNGADLDAPTAAELVPAFVQHWARYHNTAILIPQLPYAVDRGGKNSIAKRRDAEDWLIDDTEPVNGENNPLPYANEFELLLDKKMPSMTLVLAGSLNNMAGFGTRMVLFAPNGQVLDSKNPVNGMKVIQDRYFMAVELKQPIGGNWVVRVEAGETASRVQTGYLTVIGENPLPELFTNLDRHVVENTSYPLQLDISPEYTTLLHDVSDIHASVIWPDGQVQELAVYDETHDGLGYQAFISEMPYTGVYQVRVWMRTGAGVHNEAGESMFEKAFPNTVNVPLFVRTAVETFYVPKGPKGRPVGGDDGGDNGKGGDGGKGGNDGGIQLPPGKLPLNPVKERLPKLPDLQPKPGTLPEPIPTPGPDPLPINTIPGQFRSALNNEAAPLSNQGPQAQQPSAPQNEIAPTSLPAPSCGGGVPAAAPLGMMLLGLMKSGWRRRR